MAKPKQAPTPSLFEHVRAERAAWNENEFAGERFTVWEKDPDWYDDGYYGEGWKTGRRRQVSEFFYNREDAEEFINTHEPDKNGGVFYIRHEVGRYVTKIEWRSADG